MSDTTEEDADHITAALSSIEEARSAMLSAETALRSVPRDASSMSVRAWRIALAAVQRCRDEADSVSAAMDNAEDFIAAMGEPSQ